MNAKTIAKAIVATIAAAATAVDLGLFTGTAAKWVAVIIGFASAIGVYQVRNQPQPPA